MRDFFKKWGEGGEAKRNRVDIIKVHYVHVWMYQNGIPHIIQLICDNKKRNLRERAFGHRNLKKNPKIHVETENTPNNQSILKQKE
jgi:hypothetical protein